jgi:hypothetical protein
LRTPGDHDLVMMSIWRRALELVRSRARDQACPASPLGANHHRLLAR